MGQTISVNAHWIVASRLGSADENSTYAIGVRQVTVTLDQIAQWKGDSGSKYPAETVANDLNSDTFYLSHLNS